MVVKKLRWVLACALALVMVFVLVGSVGAAPTDTAKGGPVVVPKLEKIVLIHYAKGGIPGPPDKEPPPPDEEKVYDAYALLGLKWDALPVSYVINPSRAPDGAVAAVQASFEAWDKEVEIELFNDAVTVDTSAWASDQSPDFQNTVSWQRIVGPGARRIIAMTIIWYDDINEDGKPSSGEPMLDCDVVFNTAQKWGIDADGEGTEFSIEEFDVQNIGTHEAGHVCGLDDLKDEIYSEITMYGYSKTGETKKISLEVGDILGINAIY